MMILGSFNRQHLIRMMLAHEYAATITFEDGRILKFAHHKGTWHLYTRNEGLAIDDSLLITETAPGRMPLVEGLLQAYIDQAIAGKRDWLQDRQTQAWVLEKVLSFWAGLRDGHIADIEVHQPGRNASIDLTTGFFDFSPRPNEYKNF